LHSIIGEKYLGTGGDSTALTAFCWNNGDAQDMHVYWRNDIDNAQIVGAKKYSSQSDIPKWMPIGPIVGGLSFDDQFAVAQWGDSKHMRLYYATSSDKFPLYELRNDDGAGWVPGAKFGGD
jgi:hypothetical protein